MLGTGATGGTVLVNSLLGGSSAPAVVAVSAHATLTATPRPRAATSTSTPVPHISRTVPPTRTVLPTLTPVVLPTVTVSPTSTPMASTATPTATPLPSPTPVPTRGIVTLESYWVGSTSAARGSTISLGYVINNGTGRTERISLGASIKPSSTASWAQSINDVAHDVVAVIPPGVSTHVRYFTLSPSLSPGTYDVAWGLRNADSGARVALVSAAASFTVH